MTYALPHTASLDPEQQAVLVDSIGPAMLLVLDTLGPDERLAFVLHDMFDVPFDDIAAIIRKSPAAARQVASRARRRIRGADLSAETAPERQQEVVRAFLAAARNGDFAGLLSVLHPDIEYRADADAVRIGGLPVIRGARAVAETFNGQARAARPAVVDGVPAAAWAPGGNVRVVLLMTTRGGRITGIEAVASPKRLRAMNIEIFEI
jgi:RNA polymerase sigma-70 factor (ECF subfamily)